MSSDKRQIEMALQLALKQDVKVHILAGFDDVDSLKIVAVLNAVVIMRDCRFDPRALTFGSSPNKTNPFFNLSSEFLIRLRVVLFRLKIIDVIQIGVGDDRVVRMIG